MRRQGKVLTRASAARHPGLIRTGNNVFTGLQTPIGWIGLILIVTGLFGTCPLYSILGINTKTLSEKVGLD